MSEDTQSSKSKVAFLVARLLWICCILVFYIFYCMQTTACVVQYAWQLIDQLLQKSTKIDQTATH